MGDNPSPPLPFVQNARDLSGIGDWWRGRRQLLARCGGGDQRLQARLRALQLSGEKMLVEGAALGAHDKSRPRRVFVIQHYPKRCAALKKMFLDAQPDKQQKVELTATRVCIATPCTFQ